MRRYITREDAVFAACKVLDKFGGCKMGPLCPDVGCSEVRDIIDTFQMIEIPDKHGRLIDGDALFDFILNIYKTAQGDARKAYRDVLDTIVAAGDVIPAEEGE